MSAAATLYVKNSPPSTPDQIREIMESGTGIFRTQKLASDILTLASEFARLGGRSWSSLNSAASVLSQGSMGIIIPFAVSSTIEAVQTGMALAKKNFVCSVKESAEFVQQMAVSAQMIAYSGLLFTQKSICGVAGDIFSAIDDGLDVLLTDNQLGELQKNHLDALPKEARVYIEESKKLYCIKRAKAICAFAAGILGLISLVYTGLVALPLAILAISVVGGTLALWARWYKTNMTYVINPACGNA